MPAPARSWRPAVSTAAPAASGGRGLVEPLRYDDWRKVEVAAPEAFVPMLSVSVIVPYYT